MLQNIKKVDNTNEHSIIVTEQLIKLLRKCMLQKYKTMKYHLSNRVYIVGHKKVVRTFFLFLKLLKGILY